MNNPAVIQLENGHLMLSGDLDFVSVVDVWQKSLPLMMKQAALQFDLSRVSSTKSAGLALFLEWIKWARAHRKPISFHSIPSELLSLASVCGVNAIITNNPI